MDRDAMIEYGIMPLTVYASHTEMNNFIEPVKTFVEYQMTELFKNEVIETKQDGKANVFCSADCDLHGYWGGSGPTQKFTLSD